MPRVQNSNLNTRSAPCGFIAAQYFQCVEIWLPPWTRFELFWPRMVNPLLTSLLYAASSPSSRPPFMSREPRFSNLSAPRQDLLRFCQSINYGDINNFVVRDHEPVPPDPECVVLV